jgi:hypothetical protein
MSKIPLPNRGQPLDVNYIYQIADAVNSLAAGSASSSNKYVSLNTVTAGPLEVKISETRVVGGYKEVANNTQVTSGGELPWTISYTGFKYAPIVTATAVNVGNTTAGSDISVVIKGITTSSAYGIVKFKTGGQVSIGVNIIAIGIPN